MRCVLTTWARQTLQYATIFGTAIYVLPTPERETEILMEDMGELMKVLQHENIHCHAE